VDINDYFDEFMGTVWIQPDGPNTPVYPLLCVDLDGIDEPQGDVTRRFCRQGDGQYKVVHSTQGTPSSVTFDVVAWKTNQRSYMQKQVERRCPAAYYLHHAYCGRVDTFLNYDAGKLLPNGLITSKSSGTNARGRAEENDSPDMTEQTFSLSADTPAPEYYGLLPTIGDPASEDEPLRDIAKCSWKQCVGPCGELIDMCDVMNIAGDAAAAAVADGYITEDNATTFTAWAAQPFAADEDIASIVCVQVDRNTTRIIAARGTTDVANPMEIGYSDDEGATWTNVNVGSTNGEYAMHSGALFALDHRHIWLCTDQANVYFSDDGGLTWTDQNAPTPGANESLNYVHFIDENFGWAVGGFRTTPTGLFIQTTDGGEHWDLATAEPKVEMGNWVNVIDAYRVWVGLDDGTVYFSNDWGATWTQRTLPSTLVNTGDGTFISEYEGAIVGYKTGAGNGVPVCFRTFNGGHDWEEYNHTSEFTNAVAHYGLNAVLMCSINEIHIVGEDCDGVSLVWTLKPAGW